MTKDRIRKEITIDKQTVDPTNNISSIDSVDNLKVCVMKAIDDINADIKHDIVGVSWFSVKLDVSDYFLSVDTDMTYLRLESDSEYNARMKFSDQVKANTFMSLSIQAKNLGYKLVKIDE